MSTKNKIKKILIFSLLGIFIAIIAGGLFYHREILHLYRVLNLFKPGMIAENFRSMNEIFPAKRILHRGPVFSFQRAPAKLPNKFRFNGQTHYTKKFLKQTRTTGFLVVKDDRILFEEYYLGNTKNSYCISWSMGKSFVSALLGIAIKEKYIESIHDPVTDYAPDLKLSGYDGVSIKNVAQMSSGVGFNEDYGDFNSDINRMGRVLALGSSINKFAASLKRSRKPGTFNQYVSMDTQVLGMVIAQATGMTLSKYLENKIWKPLGMQSDAFWLVDNHDMELAFGTLNVTLLDFAKFGRLYLNYGNWEGKQIIPAHWVQQSVTPDTYHLRPGKNPASDSVFGYGYQWWIPEKSQGEYMALGIYHQMLYINTKRRVIIVKTSADPDWVNQPENLPEQKAIALFRKISLRM